MIIHYIVKENIFDVIVYTLSLHIKDCFKINGKQRIIMPKKGEYIKFRNFKRKKLPSIMVYADFESILVPGDTGKQNPNEPYDSKYQKQVVCSYSYRLT